MGTDTELMQSLVTSLQNKQAEERPALDPYQGTDVEIDEKAAVLSPVEFSLDPINGTLVVKRGLKPGEVKYIGQGKVPVPEQFTLTIGNEILIFKGTMGIAEILQVWCEGRSGVVWIELAVNYDEVEAMEAVIEPADEEEL